MRRGRRGRGRGRCGDDGRRGGGIERDLGGVAERDGVIDGRAEQRREGGRREVQLVAEAAGARRDGDEAEPAEAAPGAEDGAASGGLGERAGGERARQLDGEVAAGGVVVEEAEDALEAGVELGAGGEDEQLALEVVEAEVVAERVERQARAGDRGGGAQGALGGQLVGGQRRGTGGQRGAGGRRGAGGQCGVGGELVQLVEERVDVAERDRFGDGAGLAQPRGGGVAELGRHAQRALQRTQPHEQVIEREGRWAGGHHAPPRSTRRPPEPRHARDRGQDAVAHEIGVAAAERDAHEDAIGLEPNAGVEVAEAGHGEDRRGGLVGEQARREIGERGGHGERGGGLEGSGGRGRGAVRCADERGPGVELAGELGRERGQGVEVGGGRGGGELAGGRGGVVGPERAVVAGDGAPGLGAGGRRVGEEAQVGEIDALERGGVGAGGGDDQERGGRSGRAAGWARRAGGPPGGPDGLPSAATAASTGPRAGAAASTARPSRSRAAQPRSVRHGSRARRGCGRPRARRGGCRRAGRARGRGARRGGGEVRVGDRRVGAGERREDRAIGAAAQPAALRRIEELAGEARPRARRRPVSRRGARGAARRCRASRRGGARGRIRNGSAERISISAPSRGREAAADARRPRRREAERHAARRSKCDGRRGCRGCGGHGGRDGLAPALSESTTLRGAGAGVRSGRAAQHCTDASSTCRSKPTTVAGLRSAVAGAPVDQAVPSRPPRHRSRRQSGRPDRSAGAVPRAPARTTAADRAARNALPRGAGVDSGRSRSAVASCLAASAPTAADRAAPTPSPYPRGARADCGRSCNAVPRCTAIRRASGQSRSPRCIEIAEVCVGVVRRRLQCGGFLGLRGCA